ncbi:hypothetical protein [Flavivirga eckloniae]|uniref:Uncharacterized protein n=1 Tax=Flavivirga eckloniae TaxID=1803846 RepID=A0A2K9PQ62_9FLAO|nr:hypothetical protein [Flavivirga eckloniae]AUP79202.1 hypothetical protein C1H87_11005 [Flavivirga eckloniae]
MKLLVPLFSVLLCFSCIPLRIAPSIKTDKVMVAKKFKRKLPKEHAFIFEDPKDANEFYNYVNTKYERLHLDVESNVPFEIDGELFYFSFYEIEIQHKVLMLLPFLIDSKLNQGEDAPVLGEDYISRNGNRYLAITVSNANMEDCLKPDNIHRNAVMNYLRHLRVEYLSTQNYLDALFRK